MVVLICCACINQNSIRYYPIISVFSLCIAFIGSIEVRVMKTIWEDGRRSYHKYARSFFPNLNAFKS